MKIIFYTKQNRSKREKRFAMNLVGRVNQRLRTYLCAEIMQAS